MTITNPGSDEMSYIFIASMELCLFWVSPLAS